MLDYLDYIKGMDISSLDEIEKLGAKFYDHGGETVRKPLRGDNRILNVGLSPKQS